MSTASTGRLELACCPLMDGLNGGGGSGACLMEKCISGGKDKSDVIQKWDKNMENCRRQDEESRL